MSYPATACGSSWYSSPSAGTAWTSAPGAVIPLLENSGRLCPSTVCGPVYSPFPHSDTGSSGEWAAEGTSSNSGTSVVSVSENSRGTAMSANEDKRYETNDYVCFTKLQVQWRGVHTIIFLGRRGDEFTQVDIGRSGGLLWSRTQSLGVWEDHPRWRRGNHKPLWGSSRPLLRDALQHWRGLSCK